MQTTKMKIKTHNIKFNKKLKIKILSNKILDFWLFKMNLWMVLKQNILKIQLMEYLCQNDSLLKPNIKKKIIISIKN